MFRDYKIGLVVSKAGLTDGQLAVVRKKLAEVASFIDDGGHIELLVPGYNVTNPEGSIPPEVANLQYREKVRVTFIGLVSHEAGAALAICKRLEGRCDEVWCCPALSQAGRSQARVARVLVISQEGPHARKFKRITPWVEVPDNTARPKATAPIKTKPNRRERRSNLQGDGAWEVNNW